MKNIVVIPAVQPKDKNLDKFGGWSWMSYSIKAWKFWCKKNGHELVVYDETSIEDTTKFRVTVQRWFDIFNFLDNKKIEYDQVCMTDASYIPRWDMPDIFEMSDGKLLTTHEYDNFKWVYESIQGYKEFFDDYELNIFEYFNTGLMVFNKSHRDVFDKFKKIYTDNVDYFVNQQTTLRRGTDQTPFNYIMRMNDVDIKFLPPHYRVSHLPRKDLLHYNWQLDEDKTPFFIKYGLLWGFSGFDKRNRNDLMKKIWDMVKHNYQEDPTIEFIIESIGEDKHTNSTTTSNKFKTDIWDFFQGFKDKICIEFGTHKGQTTKVLSYLFKMVFTVNKDEQSFNNAKMMNVGLDNITYVPFDLYSNRSLVLKDISVALIDAGHKYDQVVSDINRCLNIKYDGDFYIVFDDYGMNIHEDHVKRAVDEFIDIKKIEVVKKIGCEPGHVFEENKVLNDYEGLICKVVK